MVEAWQSDRRRTFQPDDACLKCTLCVTACPVYRAEPLFAGPKALGPEWHRAHLANPAVPATAHVDDCTFCQLCEAACPAGVPVAHLIARHKATRRTGVARTLRDHVLARPHLVARAPALAGLSGPLVPLAGLSRHARRPRVQDFRGFGPSRRRGARGIVALYVDCFTRAYDGPAAEAAVRLLADWGFEVAPVPRDSSCCGAAAYAAGQPAAAQQIAAQAAKRLNIPAAATALVTLNATCDGTLRDDWQTFGIPLPLPIVPFAEFALSEAPAAFWEQLAQASSLVSAPTGSLFVHTTCRAKVSRGEGTLMALVRRAGAGPAERLDLECCGAAGSYAFKSEHEGVARRLGSLAGQQVGGRPGRLLVDSGTCALHLGQMTGLQPMHPARWLAESRWPAPGRAPSVG